MAKNFEHISHVKNNSIREVTSKEFYGLTPTADNSDASGSSPVKLNLAKRPATDKIVDGEIAINFKKGHESILIKNDNGEIVGFVNENDFNQSQEITAKGLAQEKLDRQSEISKIEEKIEKTIESSLVDIERELSEFQGDIDEMDLTVSSALNDLNSRINDADANITNVDNRLNQQTTIINNKIDQQGTIINNRIDQTVVSINGQINDKYLELKQMINDDGLTVSSSLNDLNTRINELEILIHQLILSME